MKTKSIWGRPPTRIYKLIDLAERAFGKKVKACIVGCSDGKFLLPFTRKYYQAVGYDLDDIALFGGKKLFPIRRGKKDYVYKINFKSQEYDLEEKDILGVVARLRLEGLTRYAHIEKRDFYRVGSEDKFNLVFTSGSLHYSINQNLSIKEKTNKLRDIVAIGGYLYVDYMMAIEESDYVKYPRNKFPRSGQMVTYFNDSWRILSCTENMRPTFERAHVDCVADHFHRFGYILAQKIN